MGCEWEGGQAFLIVVIAPGGRQRTEDRRQMTEDRRQRTEDGGNGVTL